MLTHEEIAKIIREEYSYLSTEYGVKRIGLFGSYAKNTPTETSDIDLVVEFDRPIGLKFIELTEYLETLLGRRVDVLTKAGIQGIRLAHIAQNIEDTIVYVSP